MQLNFKSPEGFFLWAFFSTIFYRVVAQSIRVTNSTVEAMVDWYKVLSECVELPESPLGELKAVARVQQNTLLDAIPRVFDNNTSKQYHIVTALVAGNSYFSKAIMEHDTKLVASLERVWEAIRDHGSGEAVALFDGLYKDRRGEILAILEDGESGLSADAASSLQAQVNDHNEHGEVFDEKDRDEILG